MSRADTTASIQREVLAKAEPFFGEIAADAGAAAGAAAGANAGAAAAAPSIAETQQATAAAKAATDATTAAGIYAKQQGDAAKVIVEAPGQVLAARDQTLGARDQATAAALDAATRAKAELARTGVAGMDGYEVDLAGIVAADVAPDGTVVVVVDGAGRRTFYVPLVAQGGLEVASITLGGVAETNLRGYEADLAGVALVTIGADGRIIDQDDGSGAFQLAKPLRSTAGATFASTVETPVVSLNGNPETAVAGYEADLAGTAYEVVGANMRRVAEGAGEAAAALTAFGTATHADGSLAYVVSVAGKLQVAAYDATTGRSTTLTGTGANVAPAITGNRRVVYVSDRDGTPKRYWQPIAGGAEWPADPSTALAMFGDSIGADGSGISATLAAMYPMRLFYKNGIGGQRTPQIARRQRGRATTGTIAGGAVPASGAVAVTDIALLNGAANRTVGAIVYGSNGVGVAGALIYVTSDGSYAFTRAAAGAAVAVPAPATIEITSGLSGEPATALDIATQVWITGRNDVGKVDYSADLVMTDVALMVANLKPLRRQFVLCGVKNGQVDKLTADGGTQATSAASKARFDQVIELNARYAATYPSFFCDWMGPAKAAGLTEPYTVGGSTYDVIKADVDSDGLHPNDAVGKPFFAGLVRDLINAKGW